MPAIANRLRMTIYPFLLAYLKAGRKGEEERYDDDNSDKQ